MGWWTLTFKMSSKPVCGQQKLLRDATGLANRTFASKLRGLVFPSNRSVKGPSKDFSQAWIQRRTEFGTCTIVLGVVVYYCIIRDKFVSLFEGYEPNIHFTLAWILSGNNACRSAWELVKKKKTCFQWAAPTPALLHLLNPLCKILESDSHRMELSSAQQMGLQVSWSLRVISSQGV